MNYYMPTKVYFDDNCIIKNADVFKKGTCAMVVTGRNSAFKNGSYEDVIKALEIAGVKHVLFNEIEENPSVETIFKARDIAIENNVDLFIGIGGGSPMDASKAISLCAKNPELDEIAMFSRGENDFYPVICVPTTAGTGSEVTQYSVLTRHSVKTKQSIPRVLFPSVALLDAKYLSSMSRNTMINTAVDTLAHLIESHLNTKNSILSGMLSEKGLRLWGAIKDKILNGTLCSEDYKTLLLASTLGGMAIAITGTSLPHALSYKITYEQGHAHGKAVGYYLSWYMRVYKDCNAVNDVLGYLGLNSIDEFKNMILPVIKDISLDGNFNEENADAMLSNPRKLANFPFEITKEELMNI